MKLQTEYRYSALYLNVAKFTRQRPVKCCNIQHLSGLFLSLFYQSSVFRLNNCSLNYYKRIVEFAENTNRATFMNIHIVHGFHNFRQSEHPFNEHDSWSPQIPRFSYNFFCKPKDCSWKWSCRQNISMSISSSIITLFHTILK